MRSVSVEVVYSSGISLDNGVESFRFSFSVYKTKHALKEGMSNVVHETHPAYNFFTVIKYVQDTPASQIEGPMYQLYMTQLDYIVPYLFK